MSNLFPSISAIRARFLRKGGETDEIKLINPNDKLSILSNEMLLDNEVALIKSLVNDSDWVVFTNIRIWFNVDNTINNISYNKILDISSDLRYEAKYGNNNKNEFSFLRITTTDESFFYLKIGSGLGFWATLNTVKFLVGNSPKAN